MPGEINIEVLSFRIK